MEERNQSDEKEMLQLLREQKQRQMRRDESVESTRKIGYGLLIGAFWAFLATGFFMQQDSNGDAINTTWSNLLRYTCYGLVVAGVFVLLFAWLKDK